MARRVGSARAPKTALSCSDDLSITGWLYMSLSERHREVAVNPLPCPCASRTVGNHCATSKISRDSTHGDTRRRWKRSQRRSSRGEPSVHGRVSASRRAGRHRGWTGKGGSLGGGEAAHAAERTSEVRVRSPSRQARSCDASTHRRSRTVGALPVVDPLQVRCSPVPTSEPACGQTDPSANLSGYGLTNRP